MLRLDAIRFRAVGTTCLLAATSSVLDTPAARAALVAGRIELESCAQALSRFDPTSDLARLNAADGSWVRIDVRLGLALAAAVRARDETGGRFDPTILPALVAAGYGRSYELLELDQPARPPEGWRPGGLVEVDPSRMRARLGRGVAVDLGGIGKGFAAERVVQAMRVAWAGLPGALVDLGGDIAVWGETPEGGPWLVAVEDPSRAGGKLGTIRLGAGGVATSGPARRRFGPGRSLHHLIDPATGRPAEGGPSAVTVVAPDAAAAEAYATALAVSPLGGAEALLGPGLGAIMAGVDDAAPIVVGDVDFAPHRSHQEVRS